MWSWISLSTLSTSLCWWMSGRQFLLHSTAMFVSPTQSLLSSKKKRNSRMNSKSCCSWRRCLAIFGGPIKSAFGDKFWQKKSILHLRIDRSASNMHCFQPVTMAYLVLMLQPLHSSKILDCDLLRKILNLSNKL